MKMRALMDFSYNNCDVKNGDEFDPASDSDARALRLYGRAESVEEDEIKLKPQSQKRKYRRRDMQAE